MVNNFNQTPGMHSTNWRERLDLEFQSSLLLFLLQSDVSRVLHGSGPSDQGECWLILTAARHQHAQSAPFRRGNIWKSVQVSSSNQPLNRHIYLNTRVPICAKLQEVQLAIGLHGVTLTPCYQPKLAAVRTWNAIVSGQTVLWDPCHLFFVPCCVRLKNGTTIWK